MKKVLVLAAAIALFATPSIAAISGTKHDLSSGNASKFGNGTINEICVYCHTPHGADTSIVNAPLWNRTNIDAAGSVYQGLSIQATYDLASINASDAPLCLSCHAGSGVAAGLNNMPNSGGAVPTATITGAAQISTDLSNDHPVGFNYAAMNALDSEIDTKANALGEGAKFFGTNDNFMWCSSCHDVHDNAAAPFLNTSNVGSGLCLACHIK